MNAYYSFLAYLNNIAHASKNPTISHYAEIAASGPRLKDIRIGLTFSWVFYLQVLAGPFPFSSG